MESKHLESPLRHVEGLGAFDALPMEMVVHFFSFLRGEDVCRLRMVCHFFNDLGKDEELWMNLFASRFRRPLKNVLYKKFGKDIVWVYRSFLRTFLSSPRSGVGMYIDWCGTLIAGEWKDDALHGYGIQIKENGGTYEGNWVKGIQEGYARATFGPGLWYEGEWKNDRKHGAVSSAVMGEYMIAFGERV